MFGRVPGGAEGGFVSLWFREGMEDQCVVARWVDICWGSCDCEDREVSRRPSG